MISLWHGRTVFLHAGQENLVFMSKFQKRYLLASPCRSVLFKAKQTRNTCSWSEVLVQKLDNTKGHFCEIASKGF